MDNGNFEFHDGTTSEGLEVNYFEQRAFPEESATSTIAQEGTPVFESEENEFDAAFNNFIGGINEALGKFHTKFQAYSMDITDLDGEMQLFTDQLIQRQEMNEQSKIGIQSDVLLLQRQLSDVLGTLQEISDANVDEV